MTRFNMLTTPRRDVYPLSDEQLQRIAPSIFTATASPRMSERYAHIPTSDIVTALRAEGFQPVRAAEGFARLDERRDYMRHVIAFRHQSHSVEAFRNVGDIIPEVMVDNSHDGTGAYRMMFALWRLICSNGMVTSDSTIGAVSVRHSGRATAGKVIEAAYEIVQGAPRVMEQVEAFRAITLQRPQREAFAEAAAELRWGRDDHGNLQAPITPARLLDLNRQADAGGSLWNTLNVVQENLVRGGVQGRARTGRRLSTRAINAPAENIRVNRRLWELAALVANAGTAPAQVAA